MLRLALRNLGAHRLRLVLTTLAIVLGVSFIAGTFVFTDSLQRSFDQIFAQRNADVVVTARSQFQGGGGFGQGSATLPGSLLSQVEAVRGVRAAEGYVGAQGAVVIGPDGRPVGGQNPAALGASWTSDPAINPFTVLRGAPPRGAKQVALTERTAELAGVDVGGTVRIVTPLGGTAQEFTVSGILQASIAGASAGGGTVSVFDLPTAQQLMVGPDLLTQIRVLADPGVSADTLRADVAAVLPSDAQARTGAQIASDAASRLQEALRFLNTFLLAFALIALFVAAFLIFNTFSMLVAQRTRELALVRAVGASSGQVRTSVLLEALVVAVLASSIGLALGLALAQLLRLLFKTFGAELPGGGLVVAPRTFVATYVIGIGVTLLAAWIPARRAGRTPPVAAMRTDSAPPARSLRLRAVVGVVLLVLAMVLAVAGLRLQGNSERAAQLVGASAFTGLLAMIVLAAFLAAPLVRVLGLPFRTATGRLAGGNARRSPRRTAATASALMIGVALMSALAVIAASATASIVRVIDNTIGADFVVFGSSFRPFPHAVYEAIKGTPGTDVVTYVRQTVAQPPKGGRTPVTGVDPALIGGAISLTFTQGSLDSLALGRTAVDTKTAAENGYRVGDVITLTYPNGRGTLTVSGLYEPAGPYTGFVVSLPTLSSIGSLEQDSAVYVTLADGANAEQVRNELDQRLQAFPVVQLQDQAQFKDDIAQQVNQVLGFLFALLALAVLIAFLGIVNTLLLSVVERTRELGLVRAIGATRPQVRRMVTIEALLIAVFGALLGVGLGVTYGALLQRVLEPEGFTELAVPGGQLVVFVVLAGVGGVLAALWPAWRASRLNMLRAIATE